VTGAAIALTTQWYFGTLGVASEPAPWQLWLWIGVTATAVATVGAGWSGVGWFHRNLTVFATSLCLLSVGLTVNNWIGYFPTVGTAWSQLTARPLPGQTDWATVAAMRRRASPPPTGVVVSVATGTGASGFEHRTEFVYLPPAWFTTDPPPRMPAVMMIGGEFNTPGDWVRAGDAVSTLDTFAAAHGGNAPVSVFVDSNGSFANDTECVNGPRGTAADHLTDDVMSYVAAVFGVSETNWGVVGFSSGGTCAVDLTVMHPDLFSVFVDIAGDLGPNAGTKSQTIDRLFGGDADAWSTFDPATAIARHAAYRGVSGRFIVPMTGQSGTDGYGHAATTLCLLGRSRGLDCSVVSHPGRHTWPFARAAFANTLPWLTERLRRPGW